MAELHDLGEVKIPGNASKADKIDALLKGLREQLISEKTDLLADNDAFTFKRKKQGP